MGSAAWKTNPSAPEMQMSQMGCSFLRQRLTAKTITPIRMARQLMWGSVQK